jgi:Asp-tRNA(Asn)/Glu-tRNA(Gln) amidotransferase A subunit family amidase
MRDPAPVAPEAMASLGLADAALGIRSGRFSCTDYAKACLARIAAREPQVQAWAWLDVDRALTQARQADQVLADGRPVGPLHGIPLGIKDIMHTRGIPTGMGSAAFAGFVPDRSAAVVEAIEQAGAYVMGKTVTSELAYYAPGKTRNPHHPAHTPGGSSSGSAAAVATGMVPGALGTQTNGSVIRPAALCGVIGFKPSSGLIPTRGIQPFSPSLDQVGVFSRSLADAGLLASLLLAPSAMAGELATLTIAERTPRLVAVRQPVWDQAEPAQQAMFAQAIASLRVSGAEIKERELPGMFTEAHAVHRTIMHFEAARELQALQVRHRPQLSTVLNQLIDEGLSIPAAAYETALARRSLLQQALAEFLATADAIVTPPAPGEAPATLDHTGSPAFCTIWSLIGVPAVTIPVGRGPAGLPLGLQLIGSHGQDPALLATAAWCARALAGGYRS